MLLNPYGEKNPGGLGRSVFEVAKNVIELDRRNSYTLYFKEKNASRPPFSGENWTYKGLGSRAVWLTGALGMDRTLDTYIFFTPFIPFFFRIRSVRSSSHSISPTGAHAIRGATDSPPGYSSSSINARCVGPTPLWPFQKRQNKMSSQLFRVPEKRITVIPFSYIPLGEKKRRSSGPGLFLPFRGHA